MGETMLVTQALDERDLFVDANFRWQCKDLVACL